MWHLTLVPKATLVSVMVQPCQTTLPECPSPLTPSRTPSSYNKHSNLPQILPLPIHPSTIHPSIHQSIIQPSSTRYPPPTHPSIHSFIHPVSTIHPFIHPSTDHSFSHPSIPKLPQSLHCQAYCVSFSPTLFIINCNLPKAGDPAKPKAKNLTCNSRASH